ncbi:hypothetical protein EJB05_13869, partial [Eragrostis curvula]
MDQSGGEIAVGMGAKPSCDAAGAGKDHLSALPDDTLVLILLRLDTAAAGGRTSVLSRRWRRVWTLLPELRFSFSPAPNLIAAALAAHEAPLRHLFVGAQHAALEPVADCLRAAARRLSGQLVVENHRSANEVDEEDPAFEIPCFDSATTVSLNLGFLGIVMPPAGVFARLTELTLISVWFHGPPELIGDAVSSPRCPSLQKLGIKYTFGLANLAIHSESLLQLKLQKMYGLQQLTVDAPVLQELDVIDCFDWNQPIANISAPQLVSLFWKDSYDPSSVLFGNMEQPQSLTLTASNFYVNMSHGMPIVYRDSISDLGTKLTNQSIGNFQYLMEDLRKFPSLEALAVMLRNEGHAFGASIFHVLRMCTSLTKFALVQGPENDLEAQSTCQSSCVCDELTNWKTEELTLNRLHAVLIIDMKGTDHEVAFLKRLFSWATVLKSVKILYTSVTASKAKEMHEKVLSLAKPETCVTLAAK